MKRGPKPIPIVERLLTNIERIPFSGCWIWTSTLMATGYGCLHVDGRTELAHRISYREFVGPIPGGMLTCHRCDVRPCINPEHLFLGTIADNNADMKAKGRHNPGERHGMSKLTADKVIEIRFLCASGVRQPKIAEQFGLCQQTVSDIHRRRRWSHLP